MKTKYNPNWRQRQTHPYIILIIRGSGSGKTNALFNLINHQPDIDQIYLHTKDPFGAKHQFLINKRENLGLKHYNDLKVFTEYSNDMQGHSFLQGWNPPPFLRKPPPFWVSPSF